MSRRSAAATLGGVALAALLAAGALVGLGTAAPRLLHRPADGVPVLVVHAGHFRHEVTAEGNLKEAESTPLSVPVDAPEGMRIAWLAPDGGRVQAGDPVVRFDASEVEKRLADGLSDRATADGKTAKLDAQGSSQAKNLDRDAALARDELEAARRFQKKDVGIFSRAQIVEAEIDEDLASRKEGHAVEARQRRERLAHSDLELVAIEKRKADLKVTQAEKLKAALEIRAPHDGIVLVERDWRGEKMRVGQQAWAGQPVARIPKLAVMQAEVFVLEEDAGGLVAGGPATVRVEAHPEVEYKAKVKRVDTVAKPRIKSSPVQYFGAVLELERTDPEVMKPGQRVVATLVVSEQERVLAVPHQAVFDRGGKKQVYRRSAGGFEAVPVTLGTAGLGRVVVEHGLADGDVVALADPQQPLPADAAPGSPARAQPGGGQAAERP